MNSAIKEKLIEIAKEKISTDDVSHDFEHTIRVLFNAEKISEIEGGDLDIIIPSALFHDLIVYPKNHKESSNSQKHSAEQAELILRSLLFPQEKIEKIKKCIMECSFSKNITSTSLESKILQDSDRLESTGAVSIMRVFASSGQMKRKFYDVKDPFCYSREPAPYKYGLDLFYSRLFKITDSMNTKTAKEISMRRTKFLISFIDQLKKELDNDNFFEY